MKAITTITANSKLNNKARELSSLLALYRNTLFPTKESFNTFVLQLRNCIDSLNKSHPRTAPFEIYSISEYGIYICVAGHPDKQVANLNIANIHYLYDLAEDSICPIEDYKVERV